MLLLLPLLILAARPAEPGTRTETVRDAAGAITERRTIVTAADGSQRITVRDAAGKIIAGRFLAPPPATPRPAASPRPR
jgi:hypothetical protein